MWGDEFSFSPNIHYLPLPPPHFFFSAFLRQAWVLAFHFYILGSAFPDSLINVHLNSIFTILLEFLRLALVTVPPSLTGVYLGPGNAFNCPISFSILCAGKFLLSLVSPGCVWSIQRHTSLEECPLHVYLQLAHAFQLSTTQTLLPVPQSITCITLVQVILLVPMYYSLVIIILITLSVCDSDFPLCSYSFFFSFLEIESSLWGHYILLIRSSSHDQHSWLLIQFMWWLQDDWTNPQLSS